MKQTIKNMRLYYILMLCSLLILSGCGISNGQDSGGTDSTAIEPEEGEEETDMNEFCTEADENGSASMQYTDAFLTADWTDYEILMGHSIEPEDSGRGWEFSVADVDFDGTLELLVTFAANHCGHNALYIYKQEDGRVVSYADTYAVFGKYVTSDIDYKAISSYMDIDLLAAYQNQNHEYRYLSLDYSIFGGNERGDIGTVTLYETILGKQAAPVKLAEISYDLPEDNVEMHFRGEPVHDAGELKDRLEAYMEGYTEAEIKYETAEKSFARDIVAQDDAYKAEELQELYQSLEKLLVKKDINVQESFAQIETDSIHKRITFPSIDIAADEEVASLINEQIYHGIIPEDFGEYGNGREDTDIQYEAEFVGDEIVSIHFHGYQSYMGSYAEYNRGMNFNLRTGKMISLKDYYGISDIRAIVMKTRECKEITIPDFPADEEEMERQIDKFVSLFDSEEYIGCTDNFFIQDNCIYFIVPPIESMRESIYIKLSLDKFSELYQ